MPMSGKGAGFTTSYAEPLRSESEMAETGSHQIQEKPALVGMGECCHKNTSKKALDFILVLWSEVIPGTAASCSRYGNHTVTLTCAIGWWMYIGNCIMARFIP